MEIDKIGFYEGRFYILSNFSAHEVEYGGVVYATSEHAYQVAKFRDPETREKIKNAAGEFFGS